MTHIRGVELACGFKHGACPRRPPPYFGVSAGTDGQSLALWSGSDAVLGAVDVVLAGITGGAGPISSWRAFWMSGGALFSFSALSRGVIIDRHQELPRFSKTP